MLAKLPDYLCSGCGLHKECCNCVNWPMKMVDGRAVPDWMPAPLTREQAIALAIEALGLEVQYRSFYRCDGCDESWEAEWSCACDSECPKCGKDFSPHDYYQIDQDGNEIKDEDNG